MKKRPIPSRRGCLTLLIIAGIILIVPASAVAVVIFSPALAAQGSDMLRAVFGDEAVAQLESSTFQIQDMLQQWRYGVGLATSCAPWPTVNPDTVQASKVSTPVLPTATPVPASTEIAPVPGPPAIPDLLPTLAWMPPQAIPLGSLSGEGVWSAYIQDPYGQTIVYRTYLQPDPSRSYAVVGVVAFDTSRTRLHYMLGSVEPYVPNRPPRSGQMPAEDKVPGVMIAMFNGGFKARHGHFGAMANGNVALPPREDLGTIGIYSNGSLQVGKWGGDLNTSPDLFAWRQNGPLVVHDGQINPRIYNNSPADWGYTVDDVSPTWRSGIGLTADGKALYYLCGPSLSMEMLAKSMLAVGISNGMQLDINNYWVHFVAVRDQNNSLRLEPLFPNMMFEQIDRYLDASSRDYFYVTLAK